MAVDEVTEDDDGRNRQKKEKKKCLHVLIRSVHLVSSVSSPSLLIFLSRLWFNVYFPLSLPGHIRPKGGARSPLRVSCTRTQNGLP